MSSNRIFMGAAVLTLFCTACGGRSYKAERATGMMNEDSAGGGESSLFLEDQLQMTDEEFSRALDAKPVISPSSRLVVYRHGGLPWSLYAGLRTGPEYDKELAERFVAQLGVNGAQRPVMAMPTLLTPSQRTIPRLRVAAARLQGELLFVVRLNALDRSREFFFADSEIQARASVEGMLLHCRTGLIVFSTVTSGESSGKAADEDYDESRAKISREALEKAFDGLAKELSAFLAKPGKN